MTGKGEKQKGDETQLPEQAVVRVRACAPASPGPGVGGWGAQSIFPLGSSDPAVRAACSLLPSARYSVASPRLAPAAQGSFQLRKLKDRFVFLSCKTVRSAPMLVLATTAWRGQDESDLFRFSFCFLFALFPKRHVQLRCDLWRCGLCCWVFFGGGGGACITAGFIEVEFLNKWLLTAREG